MALHISLFRFQKSRLQNWGIAVNGYARVSSNTQDHAAQVEALKAAGCERIFSEKASGKSTNGRPEFAKLIRASQAPA